jgi:NAD(P)-dependent dehydrogenase (short-subunit alcohol dehydrogenase family)
MPTKTAIVTGANRGIGLGLATALAARDGLHVIATLRDRANAADLERLAKATGRVTIGDLDVSDERSIEAFARTVANTGTGIDLLIHNAGIMGTQDLDQLSFEVLAQNYLTNALGPAMLTRHLRPQLRAGGLVVFISSRLGSIAVADGRRGYPYRMSKAALNMFVKQLSIALRSDRIGVLAMSPGQVKTRMNRDNGEIEVEESAAGLLRAIDGFTLEQTGTFQRYDGTTLPW